MDNNYNEIFFEAIETNNIEVIKHLISLGYDLSQINKLGYSALHSSCNKGFNELSIVLINSGIGLDIQDHIGATALHYTAQNNQLDVAKLILEKGGSLSIEDRYGNEPLWVAVFNDKGRNSRREIVELFVNYGANINHKNRAGRSPKEFASYANYENLSDLLV
jgi:ankyrin repeat protein